MKEGITVDKDISIIRKILADNKKYIHFYMALILMFIVGSILETGVGEVLKRAVDAANTKSIDKLYTAGIMALFVYILRPMISFVTTYFTEYVTQRFSSRLQVKVFERISKAPLKSCREFMSGDIITRIIENAHAQQAGFVRIFVDIFKSAILIVIISVYLIILSWELWIVIFLMACILPAIVALFSKFIKQAFFQMMEARAESNSIIQEYVNDTITIRVFKQINYIMDNFSKVIDRLIRTVLKASILQKGLNCTISFMVSLGFFVIFGFGRYLVFQDRITIGTMLSFTAMFGILINPLITITSVIGNIHGVIENARRVYEILEIPEEYSLHKHEVIKQTHVDDIIQFKNLSFGYNEKLVIHNLNFTIEPGDKVLIVGQNGTGKSTLVSLLLKFYSPQEGEILYGLDNLQDINSFEWRNNIAYIPQKPCLIAGTIAQNIAMSDSDIDMEKVKDAARSAYADEFIEALDKGYNSIIGTMDVSLSEGEKQRICIARAIMKQSSIVICDELFSSIDIENRTKIIASLLDIFKNKTLIVVSHDKLNIDFDKVINLDDNTCTDNECIGVNEECKRENMVIGE